MPTSAEHGAVLRRYAGLDVIVEITGQLRQHVGFFAGGDLVAQHRQHGEGEIHLVAGLPARTSEVSCEEGFLRAPPLRNLDGRHGRCLAFQDLERLMRAGVKQLFRRDQPRRQAFTMMLARSSSSVFQFAFRP